MLAPALFKTWVNLLCVASNNNGNLPKVSDLAFLLRTSEKDLEKSIKLLIQWELLDVIDGVTEPHDWKVHQYKSDVIDATNADRQKRYREKNRNSEITDSNGVTPVTVKRPDTDTDTDTDTESKKGSANALLASDVAFAYSSFQDLAKEVGLSEPQSLTTERSKHLSARLKECGGLEGWQHAMGKIRGSPFLSGNKTDFKATLDFVLQKSSFRKIMEGNYDAPVNGSKSHKPSILERFAAGVERGRDDQGSNDTGRHPLD